MFRIAICEDEKVVLDFETSLVNKWAAGRGCPLELDTYISWETWEQGEDFEDGYLTRDYTEVGDYIVLIEARFW